MTIRVKIRIGYLHKLIILPLVIMFTVMHLPGQVDAEKTKQEVINDMKESPLYQINNENKVYRTDIKFINYVFITGNPTISTRSVAFMKTASISGNSKLDVNMDAYFYGSLMASGNTDITVKNDTYFYNGATISGNTEIVVENDAYIKGQQSFAFNGSKSKICVRGTLHYEGSKPDYVHEEACPQKGNGIYAQHISDSDQNDDSDSDDDSSNNDDDNNNNENQGSPSLNVNVHPSNENIIKPVNGPAEGNVDIELLTEGALQASRRQPIDVAFIFDVSGSMNDGSKLRDAKEAFANAINEFETNGHPDDRFAIIPFSTEVGKVGRRGEDYLDLTRDLNSIGSFSEDLYANGGTNYTQALEKANELLKGSDRNKSIIFLTDGEPTESKGYDTVRYTTNDCAFWDWRCEDEEHTVEALHRYTIYTNNSTSVQVKLYDNWYPRGGFTLEQVQESIRNHINEQVEKLAANKIKLYSIGFGQKENVDMNLLEELSASTGAYASQATTEFINSEINKISRDINQLALSQISLNVKLPDNVAVKADSNATVEDGYANVNMKDVQFDEDGNMKPSFTYDLPLTFSQAGEYTFDDVTLTYKDLDGDVQTVNHPSFTMNVSEKEAPTFSGAAEFENPDNVSQLKKKRSSDGNLIEDNQFTVNYSLIPKNGLGEGILSNIMIYQPLPEGIALNDSSIEVIEEEGVRYAKIPLSQSIAYNGTVNTNSEELQLSESFEADRISDGFDQITLINNQQNADEPWRLQFRTNNNLDEDISVEMVFEDGSSTYIQELTSNSVWKDKYAKQPTKLIYQNNSSLQFDPNELQAKLDLKAIAAVNTKLPSAEVRYEDSSSGSLMNTLAKPEETISYEVLLEKATSNNYTLYKTLEDGVITKLAGSNEGSKQFVGNIKPYDGLVTDMQFANDQREIVITYLDGTTKRIKLAPTIFVEDDDGNQSVVPYGEISTYSYTGDIFTFGQQLNQLITPKEDVEYSYTIYDKNGQELTSGTLTEGNTYQTTRNINPDYQKVVVQAQGGFADASKQVSFIIESKIKQPTHIDFKDDGYVMFVGEDRDFSDEVVFTPSENVDKSISSWSVTGNNGNVNQNGSVLTAREPGTVNLVVRTPSGLNASVPVTVKLKEPTSIGFKDDTYTMQIGSTRDFSSEFVIEPANNVNDAVKKWKVQNPSILSNNRFAVRAKKLGHSDFTVEMPNGKTATITINVVRDSEVQNRW